MTSRTSIKMVPKVCVSCGGDIGDTQCENCGRSYIISGPLIEPLPKDFRERRGTFLIPGTWIHDRMDAVMHLMSLMFVYRAESMWEYNGIQYSACSTLFKPVSTGLAVPTYYLKYDEETNSLVISEE